MYQTVIQILKNKIRKNSWKHEFQEIINSFGQPVDKRKIIQKRLKSPLL